MNSRLIFEKLKPFKKVVTENFLIVTQEIYKNHPAYPYQDNEKKTKLLIYPSYADIDSDGKQPRMMVKVGSYQMSLMDTLNSNMSKEIYRDGKMSGYRHDQFLQVPITILVQAYAEEESSDLADELGSIILFACQEMYRGSGFMVRGVNISETDIYDRAQKIYQTSVSMTADIPWSWTKESSRKAHEEIIIEFDNDPLIVEGYRPPGAYVAQQKDPRTSK